VILIPGTLLEKLSREKLRAVLIHELAHIKRGDLWVNCMQTFLQIAYFYNPFVWLVNLIVRRVREQAVDELVLVALGAEAKSYSNTLIDIAEMAFSRPALSLRLVGVVESKKALSQRIKHILYRPLPKTAKLGILGLIVIITTAAILLPMAKAEKETTIATLPNGVVSELTEGKYPDTGYIIPANVSLDKIRNHQLELFSLNKEHVSGFKNISDYEEFVKFALLFGGDIYYYYDIKEKAGKAVFPRQNYWEREQAASITEFPSINLKNLPLETTVGTVDGREYKIRFSNLKTEHLETIIGPWDGKRFSPKDQCIIQYYCTNDATFILPSSSGTGFKSVLESILTKKENRVFEGIYCAICDGDKIIVYCDYNDPLLDSVFDNREIAKELQLERVDTNEWQIKDTKVYLKNYIESDKRIYLRENPEAELWEKSKNIEQKAENKTDVQVEVDGGEIRDEEENLQAKKIFLPDVDDKGLMLDLESGELVDVPKADTEEQIAQALDKLKKGDIVFDTSSLILVRGATSPSLPGDAAEPFKTYTIGQNLPEILNVRTKENVEYTIEVQAIDKDGCQLEYYPVHPKHFISAVPLTTLEQTLVKQLLEMVRQVEEKYPDKATHWPEGPGIYHVDSQGKVTVWHYQKLRYRSGNDSAENEVGYGSSELVKATGMYYLPDGTPLQSRWRERGGGMKDIRVNVGRTVEEGERVGLIHRHDLSSERDLLSRDGLERKIMLYSYEDEPIMIVVRIDRPLTRGSWYCGDVEFDVKYFDDYDQITFSAPPGKGRLMFVTVKLPKGMSFGQNSEGENVQIVRSTITANAAGQEKEQIVLQANVFYVNTQQSLIADYLHDEFGIQNITTDLTETQAVQFKKWITALPDTTMISSPKTLVFDRERADLNVTTQREFIVDYEKTSDSPPQYKPKRQKFTTGVELELTPELAKDNSIVHLILKLNQTELEKVEEKKHESGNMIQLPMRTNSEMTTQVAVSVGKYFLIPVAGMYPAGKNSDPDQTVKQTILLIKADCL
jgi:hypothetical protein